MAVEAALYVTVTTPVALIVGSTDNFAISVPTARVTPRTRPPIRRLSAAVVNEVGPTVVGTDTTRISGRLGIRVPFWRNPLIKEKIEEIETPAYSPIIP